MVDEDDGADGPAASLNPVGTVAEAAVDEGAAVAAAGAIYRNVFVVE